MNAKHWTALLVVSVTSVWLGAFAQDTSNQPSAPQQPQPLVRTASGDPSLPPATMLVRLLAMTPEQEQKLREIYAEHNKNYGNILLEQKLTPAERQVKIRDLRRNLQRKLETVLTPQQLQKLRNLDPEAMLVDRLTIALRLNNQQSQQLLAVMREQTAAIRAIDKEAREKGLTEQQQKEKLAELRKQIEEKVNKILTPEQQQELKRILQGESVPTTAPPKRGTTN